MRLATRPRCWHPLETRSGASVRVVPTAPTALALAGDTRSYPAATRAKDVVVVQLATVCTRCACLGGCWPRSAVPLWEQTCTTAAIEALKRFASVTQIVSFNRRRKVHPSQAKGFGLALNIGLVRGFNQFAVKCNVFSEPSGSNLSCFCDRQSHNPRPLFSHGTELKCFG